jgi:plastocyanin
MRMNANRLLYRGEGGVHAAMALLGLLLTWVLVVPGCPRAGTIEGIVTTGPDVIVYLELGESTRFAPPAGHAVMECRGGDFVPRVLPVLAGTTVDFRNSDSENHHVFSPDRCAGQFDLGVVGPGQARSHAFKAPDCFAIVLSGSHPGIEAIVAVLPTPYFTLTGTHGEYTLTNVPSGSHTVHIWSQSRGPAHSRVVVPETGVVTVDFALGR